MAGPHAVAEILARQFAELRSLDAAARAEKDRVRAEGQERIRRVRLEMDPQIMRLEADERRLHEQVVAELQQLVRERARLDQEYEQRLRTETQTAKDNEERVRQECDQRRRDKEEQHRIELDGARQAADAERARRDAEQRQADERAPPGKAIIADAEEAAARVRRCDAAEAAEAAVRVRLARAADLDLWEVWCRAGAPLLAELACGPALLQRCRPHLSCDRHAPLVGM
eukprot:CAMPEP_0176042188 /NCGR_PEP_ID=MMETSP0120_2-20121206/20932_1 /TAXON_ID=160619 /ORGANISM="Kryptoperidinium foliaceum, Strain CCMP 1326" /LENGTH=227 /DNA_ID=CAMNT_0017375597 /DNA_START=45 /DNA_END=728 /DNA_ORIENTATION=+